MSVYDFFESFFRNSHRSYGRPPEFEGEDNFGTNKPNRPQWGPEFGEDDIKHFSSMFNFVTDPYEMHQLFEQKIDEMMKSFKLLDLDPGFQGFGVFDAPDVPAITDKQDPRDHYLKPGVKIHPRNENSGDEKSGFSCKPSWLDRFGHGKDDNTTEPRTFFSFKSVIRKSVTLPDGSVKTEEIIRNPDGSEERTESHSKPEGSSTITPSFDSTFVGPDFSDSFTNSVKPEVYKDPRHQLLRPGYEKLNPNSEKIDKDLDKQIEQVGVDSLLPFTKKLEIPQPDPSGFNISIKSFTRRTVTLPNGAVESEEIVRNADGTEQRTVTHTWPDGTVKSVIGPVPESLVPTESGENKDTLLSEYNKQKSNPSIILRGVKDFIDVLFK